MFCICLYNVLRFGSPTNFGIKYLIGGIDHSKIQFSSIEYVIPNLYYYLVRPIGLTREFPFLDFNHFNWPFSSPSDYLTSEPIVGLLFSLPALLLFLRRDKSADRQAGRLIRPLLLAAICLQLFLSFAIFGATQRYRLLFDLIVGCSAVIYFVQSQPNRTTERPQSLGVLRSAATLSVVVGAIGFAHGYYPDQVPTNSVLKFIRGVGSPAEVHENEEINLSDVVAITGRCISQTKRSDNDIATVRLHRAQVLSLNIKLPSMGWVGTSPLVTRGVAGSADVVGLQWDGRAATLMHDHWRKSPVLSRIVVLAPNEDHEFAIVFDDRRQQLHVFIDGIRIMTSPQKIGPSGPVFFGGNRIGAGTVSDSIPTDWHVNPASSGVQCGRDNELKTPNCPLGEGQIPNGAGFLPDGETIALRVNLANLQTGLFYPLLSAGRAGAGDTIGIRASDSHLELLHDHYGTPPTNTKIVLENVVKERVVDLNIHWSLSGIRVWSENQILFESGIQPSQQLNAAAIGIDKINSSIIEHLMPLDVIVTSSTCAP